MSTTERAAREITRLREEITRISRDIIHEFPVESYAKGVRSSQFRRHIYYSGKQERAFEALVARYGQHALSLYHRLGVASCVEHALDRLDGSNFPPQVLPLYHEWFKRVLDDLARQPDEYYSASYYPFRLDVGVCCLRYVPVGGAWIVERSRVAIKILFGGGAREFIDYLRFLTFSLRGISPLHVIHTVERCLTRFNERNMHSAYLHIAELMRRDPGIKGLFRASWFLDPKLEEVSPELAYLSRIPLENGAKSFSCLRTQSDTRLAFAMSMARRRLHAEGKYTPRPYAYIWPRRQLLDWADKQVASERSEVSKSQAEKRDTFLFGPEGRI